MDTFRSFFVWIFLLGLFVGFYLFLEYLGFSTSRVLSFIILVMPIWLPVVTFVLFFERWVEFVQYFQRRKMGRTSIEIFLPQEVYKSPVAMELILTQLYQTASPDNHIQTYWDGKHPPVYSFELVSTHGQVRLIVNMQTRFKNWIESQFYAQYPGVEIRELDIDYTAEIPENGEGYESFAMHIKLKKPDAYPILTYFDYGMQANPKEEEKHDPMSITLETLGSLGPNEHMWIQFLVKANRAYSFKEGVLSSSSDWKDDVKAEIESIMDTAKKRGVGEDETGARSVQLTEAEKDNIKALERSLSKYAFDTYARGIYLAKEGSFNGMRIPALVASLRGTDSITRNSLGPIWVTETEWPWWQDVGGRKTARWKKEEIEEYKTRSYTERTLKDKGMVLTTEEIATLFHVPGQVILNPNVQRIGSSRSEAPSNLPV